VQVSSAGLDANASLRSLIDEVRQQADAFVFLSGGASRMSDDHRRQLLDMFGALAIIARGGHRIAVGDGGTEAGIMEAAGRARLASGRAFPLVGVAPAAEVRPRGETPLDPNHSHVVTVASASPDFPASWGSETEVMYWLFGRLSEGRPSVTVVANGGEITLREVERNVRDGRRMILIAGSGRATDALVALLRGTQPADADIAAFRDAARKAALTRRPELFSVLPIEAGAAGLRDAIVAAIGSGR
jgi:hypothetical protein